VLQQRALAALLLGLIALIGMVMLTDNLRRMVVVLAVAFVIGVTGLWLAITAMSRSRHEKSNRPRFSVLATVISVGVTGMTGIALIGFALFWTQFSQYAKCDAGANTVATRHACDQQLNNSLNANLRLFGNR
jgi:predicted PurR-regulated permease PerM